MVLNIVMNWQENAFQENMKYIYNNPISSKFFTLLTLETTQRIATLVTSQGMFTPIDMDLDALVS